MITGWAATTTSAKAFDPNELRTDGFTGILFGVLYGVLIFVGFETAANLAEETAEPKRAIPRAVLVSVVAGLDLLRDRRVRARWRGSASTWR